MISYLDDKRIQFMHRWKTEREYRLSERTETYVGLYACMHACKYVCMQICMYVCMYICMYVCMHAYMHAYNTIQLHLISPFIQRWTKARKCTRLEDLLQSNCAR